MPRGCLPVFYLRVISLSLSSFSWFTYNRDALKVEFFIPFWPVDPKSVILRPDFTIRPQRTGPDGGTGRRVRLKIWLSQGSAGSIPVPGTKIMKPALVAGFAIVGSIPISITLINTILLRFNSLQHDRCAKICGLCSSSIINVSSWIFQRPDPFENISIANV